MNPATTTDGTPGLQPAEPKAPLLTVAIPTHQRKRWLQGCLERVLSQASKLPPGLIEVLVSENAGADGSWDWLQEQAVRHPGLLRVHRNARNIGAEGNFRQLPGMSTGRYLWLLGDDDYLDEGALARIVELLRSGLDFLVVNVMISDESMVVEGRRFWNLSDDLRVRGVGPCVSTVSHFAMGFISCWVARRELFNVVDDAVYDRFKPYGLSLMADRYVTVQRAGAGLIMARPLLRSRKPPVQEYGEHFDYFGWFFEGSAQLLRQLKQDQVIDGSIEAQQKRWLLRTIAVKRILFERSAGILRRDHVGGILGRHYRALWEYWLLCLPALYVPGLGWLATGVRRWKAARA